MDFCTLHSSKPRSAAPKYTPLFFSDEASALAAGHRPCAQCRRDRFVRFGEAWSRALGSTGRAMAPEIDRVLHRERLRGAKRRRVDLEALPVGAFIAGGCGAAFQVVGPSKIARWRGDAYETAVTPDWGEGFTLLTPPSTVAALRAGYSPET